MAATYVRVKTEDQSKHRSLGAILEILQKSELASQVCERAAAIFSKLGEAESLVHDVPLEKIHFHEVGAVDAIVDVVGACIGFHALGIEKFACSALNVGGGTVRHFRGASADIHSRACELFNTHRVEPDASADDIHDGVNSANFMKVNLFERNVVDTGFGFAELCENGCGALAHL